MAEQAGGGSGRVDKAVKAHDDGLEPSGRRLTALGARWGVKSEEAFRSAIRSVAQDILGAAAVGRWTHSTSRVWCMATPRLWR